eukprot:m.62152 g.62152  ORF g.62152 m.62152 type:complete len:254 (+) comp8019_c1_seq2:251-1012(+)
MSVGAWGLPTSTIDWCEHNYHVTEYVAEFYNTISSLAIFLFSMYGVFHWKELYHETHLLVLFLTMAIVGIGSTLFHGTLWYSMQMLDELPMVYATLVFIYSWIEKDHPTPKYKNLPLYMVIYALFWSIVHAYAGFVTIFHIHFGFLILVGFGFVFHNMYHSSHPATNLLTFLYIAPFVVGFTMWKVELVMCEHVRPFQFHAWWHIMAALSCYHCGVLAVSARHEAMGRPTQLKMSKFGLPMVHPVAKDPAKHK